MTTTESQIERDFIAKLVALKYAYRPDICDRAALEANWEVSFSCGKTGKYSLYEPREMQPDNKALFKEILDGFLARYAFALPELAPAVAQPKPAALEAAP